jgi:ribosomal protein S18 acetylase RimI-like enzyme
MGSTNVTALELLVFRPADAADADAIAALHADSWRRHYRGAYADAFLDGDVEADRRALWTDRLSRRAGPGRTVVATCGRVLVGFAHTFLDEDPRWGALLDNLHVAHGYQRQGVGARLVQLSADAIVSETPGSGLYLWVLEQNATGQAFYQALGGRCVGRAQVQPPGGDPKRLTGSPIKLRYAWANPSVLSDATARTC